MADFTILDAPETPAPVFAFRALKGVIFGSPNNDNELHNKENANPTEPVRTLRSKISALRAPSVSPLKRRKINQNASPAKSILRIPGIPTPRKQNANVTFKDVTPSLSPELTRKSLVPTEQLAGQDLKSTNIADPSRTESAKHPLPQGSSLVVPQLGTEIPALQQAHVTFDFEAYRLSTEKEMKKLVRYGQKMREYARKQDEENTKLRMALEQLQKENEELLCRERLRDDVRPAKDDNLGNHEPVRQVPTAKVGKSQVSGTAVAKMSRMSASQMKENQAAVSLASRSPDAAKAKSSTHGQISPLKRKASMQLRPGTLLPHNSTQVDSQVNNALFNENNVANSRPVGAQLPLERVVAARERIRLKAELRRKTTANPSSLLNWDAL